jgi:acyl-CoA synthetase (AMP-forming)/AMP-acid ligase II
VLTLADPLEHAARVHAERLAVIDGELRFSYAQLHERARRLAVALRELGARSGDRIALLSANSHRYLEAFIGAPAHGLILVPLNTRLAMPELRAVVEDSGARFLLSDRDPGPLTACVERVVSIPDEYERLLAAADPAQAVRAHDEDAVAALFYTGGTTGLPKGVMLTHRNLVANAFHKTIACSLTQRDVFLAAPAMFHVAGIAPLLSLVWLGATIVMLPGFDPERSLDAIAEQRVTILIPVPTMIVAMIAAQRSRPRDVSSLRMLGHAGSPIAAETIAAAVATFPGAELAQFYGATETASVVTCLRDEQDALGTPLLGSCGRATPGVSVKVVRPDGSECEPGEVGEVVVRGPNVTVGYWKKPEATQDALRGGGYHTGDLGLMHRDGALFIVDRLKDMIVSGAENVYSIEVEDVLHRHPAVLEAAVFGIPDATWGEAVHAVVVVSAEHATRGEALRSELKAHCRATIAGYKVPKAIELQTEPLPKSGPGKILKRALRDPHWKNAPQGRRV